jgi:hypothetical protein
MAQIGIVRHLMKRIGSLAHNRDHKNITVQDSRILQSHWAGFYGPGLNDKILRNEIPYNGGAGIYCAGYNIILDANNVHENPSLGFQVHWYEPHNNVHVPNNRIWKNGSDWNGNREGQLNAGMNIGGDNNLVADKHSL